MYAIEQQLRDFCSELVSDKLCTVFAVFDMCKDLKTRYGDLTLKIDKKLSGTAKGASRG